LMQAATCISSLIRASRKTPSFPAKPSAYATANALSERGRVLNKINRCSQAQRLSPEFRIKNVSLTPVVLAELNTLGSAGS
jgi:hypothetical protein